MVMVEQNNQVSALEQEIEKQLALLEAKKNELARLQKEQGIVGRYAAFQKKLDALSDAGDLDDYMLARLGNALETLEELFISTSTPEPVEEEEDIEEEVIVEEVIEEEEEDEYEEYEEYEEVEEEEEVA